jgi:hypothetical protein
MIERWIEIYDLGQLLVLDGPFKVPMAHGRSFQCVMQKFTAAQDFERQHIPHWPVEKKYRTCLRT